MMKRVILLKSVQNIRTLGGLKTKSGKRIKKDILLRSAAFGNARPEDLLVLREEYKLTKMIDLRTMAEKEKAPDVTMENVEYLYLPISRKTLPGISRELTPDDRNNVSADMLPDMREMYQRVITDPECQENFAKVLRTIMSHRGGAVLWHCTAGKDRCGLVTVFLLGMLGVSRKEIMRDYLLTNLYFFDAVRYYLLALIFKRDKALAEKLFQVYIARKSYLQAAFNAIDHQYGGMKHYIVNQLGITPDEIKRFREYCLEEV